MGAERGARRFGAWLAVAAWAGTILWLSGNEFAAGTTAEWLGGLARTLWPGAGEPPVEMANLWLRRGAHLFEYAVLAALAFRALRPDSPVRRAAALSLALVAAVAVADETHQAFQPDRTGSPLHVALDLGGGAGGVLAAVWLGRVRATAASPGAA